MQKRIWVWGLVAALVVAAGLWFWNTDEMKDRRVWNRFRDQLTDTNVTKVALEGAAGKRFTMTDSDRRELLELLRSAKFDRSNRVGQGPTVQAFLRLTFADGREATIRIWGVDTYELSPQWLDPGTQFLIKNAEPSTTVYQIDGMTGTIKGTTPTSGRTIVGAGVSTCAPVVIL